MISFLFRMLGFIFLAVAAMYAVIDGTKSIAASRLVMSSFGDSWRDVNLASLASLRKWLEAKAPFAWDPLMVILLSAPTALVIFVLALIFLFLGKKRRRPYY